MIDSAGLYVAYDVAYRIAIGSPYAARSPTAPATARRTSVAGSAPPSSSSGMNAAWRSACRSTSTRSRCCATRAVRHNPSPRVAGDDVPRQRRLRPDAALAPRQPAHARRGCSRRCARCAIERGAEFNLEGDAREELIALAIELSVTQFTLVPVKPGEITSDHGWDLPREHASSRRSSRGSRPRASAPRCSWTRTPEMMAPPRRPASIASRSTPSRTRRRAARRSSRTSSSASSARRRRRSRAG